MSTSPLPTSTLTLAGDRTNERLGAVLLAAFLGLGLVFMAGFAPAAELHNAAHDFRHAQNFPCH
jgi:cobalt transporter subunit CbtB